MSSISTPASFGAHEAINNAQRNYISATNIVNKHLASRITAIAAILHTAGAAVIDTAKGVIFAATSVVCLGRFVNVNKAARANLNEAGTVVSRLFEASIRVINPNAGFDPRGEGVATTFAYKKLCRSQNSQATNYNDNKLIKFFAREVASRAISIIKVPTAVVARVVDLAIGALALVAATILLGNSELLNSLAYDSLKGLKVVSNVYQSVMELLNPRAFIEPRKPIYNYNLNINFLVENEQLAEL